MGSGPNGVTRAELQGFKCTTSDGPSYEHDVQDLVFHDANPVKRGGQIWLWGERAAPGGSLRGLAAAEVLPPGSRDQTGNGRVLYRIRGLGVARHIQRQGLGFQGMQTVLEDLDAEAARHRSILIVETQVHTKNIRSAALCAKFGLAPRGLVDHNGYRWWRVVDPLVRDDQ